MMKKNKFLLMGFFILVAAVFLNGCDEVDEVEEDDFVMINQFYCYETKIEVIDEFGNDFKWSDDSREVVFKTINNHYEIYYKYSIEEDKLEKIDQPNIYPDFFTEAYALVEQKKDNEKDTIDYSISPNNKKILLWIVSRDYEYPSNQIGEVPPKNLKSKLYYFDDTLNLLYLGEVKGLIYEANWFFDESFSLFETGGWSKTEKFIFGIDFSDNSIFEVAAGKSNIYSLSPNSTQFIYSQDGTFYLNNLNDDKKTEIDISSLDSNVVWLDNSILFLSKISTDDYFYVFKYNLENHDMEKIFNKRIVFPIYSENIASISPDGKFIIYLESNSYQTLGDGINGVRLYNICY